MASGTALAGTAYLSPDQPAGDSSDVHMGCGQIQRHGLSSQALEEGAALETTPTAPGHPCFTDAYGEVEDGFNVTGPGSAHIVVECGTPAVFDPTVDSVRVVLSSTEGPIAYGTDGLDLVCLPGDRPSTDVALDWAHDAETEGGVHVPPGAMVELRIHLSGGPNPGNGLQLWSGPNGTAVTAPGLYEPEPVNATSGPLEEANDTSADTDGTDRSDANETERADSNGTEPGTSRTAGSDDVNGSTPEAETRGTPGVGALGAALVGLAAILGGGRRGAGEPDR